MLELGKATWSSVTDGRRKVQGEKYWVVGLGMRNLRSISGELEGVYVDEILAQGIIEGRSFTHPDLRMQFVVPAGYLMQNSTDAVSIAGGAGQAQFSGGRFDGNIDQYIYRVFQQLTGGRTQLAIPLRSGRTSTEFRHPTRPLAPTRRAASSMSPLSPINGTPTPSTTS